MSPLRAGFHDSGFGRFERAVTRQNASHLGHLEQSADAIGETGHGTASPRAVLITKPKFVVAIRSIARAVLVL